MRYYSDLTKTFYNDIASCEKAEKLFEEERVRRETETLKKANMRKEAAKRVENAYNNLINAKKTYQEELNTFCKEYGSFHMTVDKNNILDWINSFWEDIY